MTSCVDRELAEAIAASGNTTVSKLGLRFDRVVVRVLGSLRVFTESHASEGRTVLLTLTAPIRGPKIAAVALEREIAGMLRRACDGHRTIVVNSNHAELRLVTHASLRCPKLLGFVHNPDVDAAQILRLAEQWVQTGVSPC